MRKLAVGESRTFQVDPREFYVQTGYSVASGERYGFQASGRWKDAWLPACGPDGWGGLFALLSLLFRYGNRLPAGQVLQLCGSLGRNDAYAFAIGSSLEWLVPATASHSAGAELCLFANDWPARYANHKALPKEKGGPLTVALTRLA